MHAIKQACAALTIPTISNEVRSQPRLRTPFLQLRFYSAVPYALRWISPSKGDDKATFLSDRWDPIPHRSKRNRKAAPYIREPLKVPSKVSRGRLCLKSFLSYSSIDRDQIRMRACCLPAVRRVPGILGPGSQLAVKLMNIRRMLNASPSRSRICSV